MNFVRVTDGQVSGVLAPYTDPTCNCSLHTTFIGRLTGDTLAGTYTSRHEQPTGTQQGRTASGESHDLERELFFRADRTSGPVLSA